MCSAVIAIVSMFKASIHTLNYKVTSLGSRLCDLCQFSNQMISLADPKKFRIKAWLLTYWCSNLILKR